MSASVEYRCHKCGRIAREYDYGYVCPAHPRSMIDTCVIQRLYTFELDNGKQGTYAGANEHEARRVAERQYPGRVCRPIGMPARPCECGDTQPLGLYQAGIPICANCAGFIGLALFRKD